MGEGGGIEVGSFACGAPAKNGPQREAACGCAIRFECAAMNWCVDSTEEA